MKKLLTYFLGICLLLPITACSRQSERDIQKSETITRMQLTHQEYLIPDGIGIITAQCVNESQILIGVTGEQARFGGMNFDGSGELSVLSDDYKYIYAACVMENGAVILVGDSPASHTVDGSYVRDDQSSGELYILLYDRNNRLINEISLIENYSGNEMNFTLMLYADGHYLLMSQAYLIRINADGTESGRIARDDGIAFSSMCFYDDQIIVSRGQLTYPNSQICSLDLKNFTFQAEIDITGSRILGLGISENGRLLINDAVTNAVNYLDITSGETAKLFSWSEAGLHMPDAKQIMWIKGGYVFFIPYQNIVNIVEYVSVTKERTELILATTQLTPELNKLVYHFNNQNEDYKITVVEYDGNGRNKTLDNLRTEVLAGKAPDIYAFEGEDPFHRASNVPLYEDMLPYLDADSEYSRETFMPSVLAAFLRDTGKLYWIPYEFVLFTFTAPIHFVGDRISITMEEAERIARENDLFVFDDAIYNSWLLSMACNVVISRYIDPLAGTCDFDNPDFIALLKKCNEHPSTYPDEPTPYRCLMDRMYLFGLSNYSTIKNLNLCFVGFPVTGEASGVIMDDLRFAISSQSEYKDAAWEFIRYTLSSENQQAVRNFPVVQKELELQLEKAMAGQFVDWRGVELKLEQSDVDRLWNIIERSSYLLNDDKVIWGIIMEEAAMYFAGDRTVEETARIIQNRLSMYVSENSLR